MVDTFYNQRAQLIVYLPKLLSKYPIPQDDVVYAMIDRFNMLGEKTITNHLELLIRVGKIKKDEDGVLSWTKDENPDKIEPKGESSTGAIEDLPG